MRLLRNIFVKQTLPDLLYSFCSKRYHVFFGYFDIIPISPDEKLILAGRVKSDASSMEVGFYNLKAEGSNFVSLGSTKTWCWQMGCRLQWFPSPSHTVIYNSLVNGSYGSIIQKTDGNILKKNNYPIS